MEDGKGTEERKRAERKVGQRKGEEQRQTTDSDRAQHTTAHTHSDTHEQVIRDEMNSTPTRTGEGALQYVGGVMEGGGREWTDWLRTDVDSLEPSSRGSNGSRLMREGGGKEEMLRRKARDGGRGRGHGSRGLRGGGDRRREGDRGERT